MSYRLCRWAKAAAANRHIYFLAIGLLVTGARLWTVKVYGVQEPLLDSWNEPFNYVEAKHNHWRSIWHASLTPNNEHIIFFTRWLNVAFFTLNQQKWDPLAVSCFNAFLAGCCAVALLYGFTPARDPVGATFVGAMTALVLAPPFAFENILWDFQSQHYFFILSSLAAMTLLLGTKPLGKSWWIGLLISTAACLTLGSGFYAALCIGIISIVRLWINRRRSKAGWWTVCICGVIVALNLTLEKSHAPEYWKARSLFEFVLAFLRQCAWPSVNWQLALFGILVFLPMLVIAFFTLVHRQPLTRFATRILCLGFWTVMLDLTLAYLRGTYVPYPRYYDYYAVGLIANAGAIAELWRIRVFRQTFKMLLMALCSAWTTAAVLGASHLADFTFARSLPERERELRVQQKAVQNFLETGNEAALHAPELHNAGPFDQAWFPRLLSDRDVQALLPDAMLPAHLRSARVLPLTIFRTICFRVAGALTWCCVFTFSLLLIVRAWLQLNPIHCFRERREALRIISSSRAATTATTGMPE